MSRKQHVPWRAAGTSSEAQASADDVVRETGWVFNNITGRHLSLAEFVETGNHETLAYLTAFGLGDDPLASETLVEIGSGIGRMTSSFTRLFGRVVACDLDAAFLERCRETVAQFGRPERLQTSPVGDGHTISLPDDAADLAFSYITLQHCADDDALGLSREAVRVAKPGGKIALNYRTWVDADALLWPAGKVVRAGWKMPGVGKLLSRWRWSTRVGWQANRLSPEKVVEAIGASLTDVRIVRAPKRFPFHVEGTTDETFEGVNPSHWWLVGVVRRDDS